MKIYYKLALLLFVVALFLVTMIANVDRHIVINTPDGSGKWQIYFDTGSGYSEQESVKFIVIDGRGFALAPTKAFYFRLDPPDGCLHASISEIRMTDDDRAIVPEATFFHNIQPAKPIDDRSIVLEMPQGADDPQVVFAKLVPSAKRLFGFIPPDYKMALSIILFFIAIITFILIFEKPKFSGNLRDWRYFTEKKSFWLLLAAGLLFARAYDRVQYAVLWAEDGPVYLKEALDHGISSLFIPYAGYFQIVPRILGYLASLLPITWMPYFITISSLLVVFGVLSEIMRDRYEWLLPDIRQRGLLMLVIILSPGTNEIVGALSGLYWFLYLYVALLGISFPGQRFRWIDLAIILLAILSNGAVLTLLPLYLTRIGWHVLKRSGKSFIAQECFVLFGILAITVVNLYLRTNLSATSFDPDVMSHLYWKSILCEMVSYPVVAYLPYLIRYPVWIFATLPLGIYLLIKNIKMFSSNKIFFVMFIFSLTLIPPMISMARAGSADLFVNHFHSPAGWTAMRYSFIMPLAGYILWFVTFSSSKKHEASGVAFAYILFLMAFVFTVAEERFFIKFESSNNEWSNRATEIALTRKDTKAAALKVPIEPDGWFVDIAPGSANK